MSRKELKKRIHTDLNNNSLLNIFGLVNVAAVRARVEGLEKYTDDQVKDMIRETFDKEVINGVQFIHN